MYFIENKFGKLINVFFIETIEMTETDGPVATMRSGERHRIKHADFVNFSDNGHLPYLAGILAGKEA